MKALLALLVAGAVLAPQAAGAAPKAKAKPVTHAKSVLPWVEDDYERAIADAKARGVPVFVESWAPW